MEVSKELAEILGMFAADGCLQKDYICMWGNIYEDKDYYDNIVCPFYSKVFGKKITAHEKKSNSVYGFYLCDKKVVEFFKSLGFSNNKTYTVRIPKEIMESEDNAIVTAFIRGFTDCDGCFSLMKRKGKYRLFKTKFNTYPRISISIVSLGMINDICSLLKRLNLKHTSGIERKNSGNEKDAGWIWVRGPKAVEDWINIIGFNNPAQYTKYLVWKKFGFCPIKIGIKERKKILKGQLNPLDFYKK